MTSRRWTWVALYLLHAIDYRRMSRYISGFTSDLQLK
jgi:hypothetical protein